MALDGPFGAVIGSSILHQLELSHTSYKIFRLLKPMQNKLR